MKKFRIFSRLSPLLLIIVLVGSFIFSAKPAKAIPVEDIPLAAWNTLKSLWQKSGSAILNNILRTTVNKLAYDYATYLGSGGKGQKPFFEQVPLEKRLLDAADSGFGQVLEVISQEPTRDKEGNVVFGGGLGVNLCSPDLNILKKITLGLADQEHTPADFNRGKCSFREFQQGGAWDTALRDFHKNITKDGGKEYMRQLAGTLDPGVSDIAVSMELMDITFDVKTKSMGKVSERAKENGGWLRVENIIGGKYKNPPGSLERQAEGLQMLQTQGIGKYTGDVLIDAANVFLNQLALTAFNKLMEKIGERSDDSGGNIGDDLYGQGSTGGVTEVSKNASKLLQASFSERADYDVLSKLTICTNEQNPGPTDCVITQQFGQAIENQMTVAEATDTTGGKSPLIDPSKRVGYDEEGNDLSYTNGYPYRSLIILRKYRILPVGWEVAAQYIKNHPQETKSVNLQKLLECYDPTDPLYEGYDESWCEGLIDPNWVLKLPKLYCGMEGYGPEIISSFTQPSNIGYCAKSSSINDPIVDCTNQPTSEQCQTNWSVCTKDGDCGSGFDYCNFTIGKNLSIMRDKNYCADERSCIKEDEGGACSNYGYCTEEQRRWSFGQPNNNSCEARNNTCQSFSSIGGSKISFLQNTLDYSNCGINDVGCKKYVATGSSYDKDANKIDWNNGSNFRYFNNKITECNTQNEGCHQFIRIKDDLDSNLIADGNFEISVCRTDENIQNETLLPNNKLNPLVKQANAQTSEGGGCRLDELTQSGYLSSPNNNWYIRVNSGTVKAGIVKDEYSSPSQSLYIEGYGGLYSDDNSIARPKTILPVGFNFENDRFYTLSAQVYVKQGGVKVGFGTNENGQSAIVSANNSFQNVIITYYRPVNGATNFYIEGIAPATKFYIDELKLTVGSADTSYSEYFDNNVIYQKLLPDYMESSCYVTPGTNYNFKTDAPDLCKEYARKCNANEVGCETYTLTENSSINITGKIKPKDFCPESCLGYNVFVEQPTTFSARNTNYFIPATAQTCSSQAVGCTAFTNLDKLSQGGEATEYYSYLRKCIKPDTASCGEFYTWEGSNDTGYQIRVFSLKKNANEPDSTMDPAAEQLVCNEAIFNKEPSDPGYNYDCRQFYSQDGTISYHLYTRTITCSDNCHPYRREVATRALCESGGGTWDTSQTDPRCLYYTIPGEGTACNAAQVNCREYTGNIANNIRIVNYKTQILDNFESTTDPENGWMGGGVSNTSLELSQHSYAGTNISKFFGAYDPVKQNYGFKKDESYSISFLAKSQTTTDTYLQGVKLVNKENNSVDFEIPGGTKISNEWKIYTFNLGKLSHEVTPIVENGGVIIEGEKLLIDFSSGVFIDNIRLTEIKGRHYLIKDSWNTPDECDQTVTGEYSYHYMLGCSQYRDRSGGVYNLHGFTELCQASAAGCEQMIDTHNSSNQKASTTGGISVPADNIINVVYDKTKKCTEENKGCQRFGLSTVYDGSTIYSDIYLNNDPDKYSTSTCSAQAVGCSEWSDTSGGKVYFKDPGDMVCEWRLKKGDNSGQYRWFKKKVKRCGGVAGGAICVNDDNCAKPQTCQLYDVDDDCTTTYNKTIGSGGQGNFTPIPASWAGLCEDSKSGCTEYIDPLSKFSENLIKNPSYQNGGEYWSQSGDAVQQITINPQTIYIIKGAGGDNDAKIKIYCPASNGNLMALDSSNNFSELEDNETSFIAGTGKSLEFYYQSTISRPVSCTVTRDNRTEGQSVYLRQAIVSYQLAQNLDRTSPNGIVKPDTGWVLFNERAQNGSGKKSLIYNADTTYSTPVQGSAPDSNSEPKNANVILKVRADRTCSKWLSCLTYTQDPNDSSKKVCLNVGLCDKISGNGTCLHFVENSTRQNQYRGSNVNIANLSGYSKVGYVGGNKSETLDDYYNIALMSQTGESIEIPNGGFETNSNWEPTGGAIVLNQPDQIDALNLSPFRTVKDNSLQSSNNLVPEGAGLLKLVPGGSYKQSNSMSLALNRRYVLTFYAYAQGNGFKIRMIDTSAAGSSSFDLVTFGENTTKNKWVKYSFGFKALSTSYKIQLENSNGASGNVYVDDLRLDPGLNYRCSNPSVTDPTLCNDPAVSGQCSITTSIACNYDLSCPEDETCINSQAIPNYIGSSCRLYAKEGSLACSYIDEKNTRHKGIYGYCLESDPKNPAICLLWYPTSRISGDQTEELPTINFGNGNSVYYCVDAKDRCSISDPLKPEFYCNQFIKVNSGGYYWYQRMSNGSSFKMPDNTSAGKYCSRTQLSCSTSNDCPPVKQVCNWIVGGNHGWCSISGAWCDNSGPCLDMIQSCDEAGPKFPDSPTFWPNTPPTSVRQIDFGVKASNGNPTKLVIDSISRNLGQFFGSALIQGTPSYNDGIIEKTGNSLDFYPYYGFSNKERCDLNNPPPLTNETYFLGNSYGNVDPGEGNPTSMGLGNWDFCSPVWAAHVDFNYRNGCSNNSNNCKYRHIDETFGNISCSNYDSNTCNLNNRVDCWTENNNGNWTAWNRDTNSDTDDTACGFYCFNRTNSFTIAKGINQAKDALKRIFINKKSSSSSLWEKYDLINNAYSPDPAFVTNSPDNPLPCNVTGVGPRPVRVDVNSNDDYCYINPIISNFKINGDLGKKEDFKITPESPYAVISFDTKTDSEQLPIKDLVVDWGYKNSSGQQETTSLGHNLADITGRTVTKHLDYWTIKNVPANNSICDGNYCSLDVKITITDNWGYSIPKYYGGNGTISDHKKVKVFKD